MLRGMPGHAAGTVSIVQAAGQGDLQTVKDIISKHPDKVSSCICPMGVRYARAYLGDGAGGSTDCQGHHQ